MACWPAVKVCRRILKRVLLAALPKKTKSMGLSSTSRMSSRGSIGHFTGNLVQLDVGNKQTIPLGPLVRTVLCDSVFVLCAFVRGVEVSCESKGESKGSKGESKV